MLMIQRQCIDWKKIKINTKTWPYTPFSLQNTVIVGQIKTKRNLFHCLIRHDVLSVLIEVHFCFPERRKDRKYTSVTYTQIILLYMVSVTLNL